uniref:EGF-like domain-containing protein n=1 Tax=Globodera pallida TaxID=36090 RepID=A0A183CLB8_GLOPA
MNTPKFLFLLFGFSLYYKLGDFVHAATENGQQQHGAEGQCDKNSETDFDCGDGELRTRCITSFWHCDQIFDCSTGKDELDCMYLHKCPAGHIACRNGDCFSATSRCDGHKDCDDGWDERGCNEAKGSTAESSLNIVEKMYNRHLADEGEHENGLDITDLEGQAEAMVDESDRETNSASFFLLFSTLLFIALLLGGLAVFSRYPNTFSRLDHTFKEFNRSISSSARTLLNNKRASSVQSHVTITTSPNSNNDHQYFDNPLHLHQPSCSAFTQRHLGRPLFSRRSFERQDEFV